MVLSIWKKHHYLCRRQFQRLIGHLAGRVLHVFRLDPIPSLEDFKKRNLIKSCSSAFEVLKT